MRLALPSLAIFLYVAVSLLALIPCRPWTKVAFGVVLLVISQKYLIYERIGGSFIAPELPLSLMMFLEAIYSSLLILCFLLLIRDVTALSLWTGRWFGAAWQLPFSYSVQSIALVLLALMLGIFGTWQSLQIPQVKTVEVPISGLPAPLDGFSIVQLTDLHIGYFLNKEWLSEVVKRTNELSPDLVALTGDMIEGSVADIGNDMEPLRGLSPRYGVFGITGNHEHYFQTDEWLQKFKQLGVSMLHNEHRVLTVKDGAELVVAGVPDKTEVRSGGKGPDVRAALMGAPDATRILLAHRPNGISENIDADLQLSGHTHGGHLFFMQWLISTFNGGLVNGLYNIGGMSLYVSPGTGLWAGFSCRLGVPAEITQIVLRRRM
ncbi:metallophosphoesterase [uncultured Desulfuromusa sp.]|uniref:metallophosphoesterase n=1 Tax=uncultured Desulfuromusa sp. TaxID=219183 RepID=UPI002AA6CC22|nr:metallophosphoesterase [uncultured Desulfuromusa sp.]